MLASQAYQNVWSVFLEADGGHWVIGTVHVDWLAVPSEANDFAVSNFCQLLGLGARWSCACNHSQLTLWGVADSKSHHSTCHVDECVEFDPFAWNVIYERKKTKVINISKATFVQGSCLALFGVQNLPKHYVIFSAAFSASFAYSQLQFLMPVQWLAPKAVQKPTLPSDGALLDNFPCVITFRTENYIFQSWKVCDQLSFISRPTTKPPPVQAGSEFTFGTA